MLLAEIMRSAESQQQQIQHTASTSQQALQSNKVLEVFGNAATIHNHNSSRYGKMTKISFDASHKVQSIEIDTYLLEKTRVTGRGNPSERSFHIFYQVVTVQLYVSSYA
jgi:myosin-5